LSNLQPIRCKCGRLLCMAGDGRAEFEHHGRVTVKVVGGVQTFVCHRCLRETTVNLDEPNMIAFSGTLS
jgi:hypothetical protein